MKRNAATKMTEMRLRRMSRVLRVRGVDIGFAVYENDEERVTEMENEIDGEWLGTQSQEAQTEVCATVGGIWRGGGCMKMFTRLVVAMVGASVAFTGVARAQKPPLLPEKDVAALANELSGETAKRNLEGIARFHRQRGSQGFHEAAELVAERLRAYGLSDVAILQFPADGATMDGTQRSRPEW